jgi:hypothetical protein
MGSLKRYLKNKVSQIFLLGRGFQYAYRTSDLHRQTPQGRSGGKMALATRSITNIRKRGKGRFRY